MAAGSAPVAFTTFTGAPGVAFIRRARVRDAGCSG